MINIDAILKTSLIKKPFKYALIHEFFNSHSLDDLLANMPYDNYFRSIRDSGSDKTYNVVNNLLLKLGDKSYNKESNLHESWIKLVKELQSQKYISALSTLLKDDLSGCSQEITLKKYGYGDFISAHTDKENVRATHMLFLNKNWDEKWGGRLCFMYNPERIFKRFLPVVNQTVVFIRADNSWHSVENIVEPSAERVAIQVAFWNITSEQRTVLPGRTEQTI